MTHDRITALIVDDHAVVRQGVRAFLESQPDICVVGEAGFGEEAIRLCMEHAPDIVLMDLIMPGMDGVETTREVKRVSPRSNIIVLTSYHENEHILPAMRAGATSYILKDVSPEELVEAVRRASRGEATLHPSVAAKVVQGLRDMDTSGSKTDSDLTPRELEVLSLIAEGLANAEIAEKLFISEKTVKSHVSNILSKLQLADRTQAAVYAWREGLMKEKR
jgi:NarL family two-component system response regulator LiaR